MLLNVIDRGHERQKLKVLELIKPEIVEGIKGIEHAKVMNGLSVYAEYQALSSQLCDISKQLEEVRRETLSKATREQREKLEDVRSKKAELKQKKEFAKGRIDEITRQITGLEEEILKTNLELKSQYDELLEHKKEIEQKGDFLLENYQVTEQDAHTYIYDVVLKEKLWLNFPCNMYETESRRNRATSVGDALAYIMNQSLMVVSPEGEILHFYQNSEASETIYLIQHQNHYMRGVVIE
jgi:DNA repair exonuclease SbcCD ATPase subunit